MIEDYVPTGIPGVDKILADKGIPKGHTILVSGGPVRGVPHSRGDSPPHLPQR